MTTALRNQTFQDVQHIKLFSALKREARFPGWLDSTDERYVGLQTLCNDIIQSTVNVQMPLTLVRNENCGAINGFGDTNLFFVADAEAWQICRDWLQALGIQSGWW